MNVYFIVLGYYIFLIIGLYYIFFTSFKTKYLRYREGDKPHGILKNIVKLLNSIAHKIGLILGKIDRSKRLNVKNRIFGILEYEKDMHITFETFLGYKFISSALLMILGCYIGKNLFCSIAFGMIGGMTGYFIPNMIVNRFAAKISEDIDKELSYAIDLLRVSTLSGQNMYNSFTILIEKYDGTICHDLRNFIRDIDMGAGNDCAYRNLVEGNKSKQFRELMSVLMEADKYGSPMSSILMQRSRQINFENWDNAERKAKRIGLLSLLPLVFLILPAFILLVGGPLIFSLASGVF